MFDSIKNKLRYVWLEGLIKELPSLSLLRMEVFPEQLRIQDFLDRSR